MIKYTPDNLNTDVETILKYRSIQGGNFNSIYGVPRGGVLLGMLLAQALGIPFLTDRKQIEPRTLIVDDVCDSGATRRQFGLNNFLVLHKKKNCPFNEESPYPDYVMAIHKDVDDWIHYFWEGEEASASITDSVVRMLQYIGENPEREGLKGTPDRVVKAWNEMYAGYKMDPLSLITTFDDCGDYNEMVLLRDIEFFSTCEHHLLPFYGKAHVAYIPNKRVIGVSKLARILDVYARRAQIQERIGSEVTSFLIEHLKPAGAACIIEASHMCMQMRGVQKQNSKMVTSSLKGVFLTDSKAREELTRLIR